MSRSDLPESAGQPGRVLARQSPTAGWRKWLSGLDTLAHYQPDWLRYDLVAGLVLTTMLVPVGIAYAQASGIPGIYGLYATMIPLLAYAFLVRAVSWCWGQIRRWHR